MRKALIGKIKNSILFCLPLLFLLTSCEAAETAAAPDHTSAGAVLREDTASPKEEDAGASVQEEAVPRAPSSQTHSPAPALSEMQVHFIDVGQGDSTLIICGNDSLLIDGGDNNKGTALQLYLQKQGIQTLTYLIGTHPDSDHIGGLDVIITKFDCGTIILPDVPSDTATYRDVIDAMEYRGCQITLPCVGDTYSLGDAEFTIIAPNSDYAEDNNASVGIRLVHGNNVFLFTGDAEEKAEADILENSMDIRADVLHAGHHGSSTSNSRDFIDSVSPLWAVISCGADNPYGHPHEQTLNTFRERGIQVFRTDEQGSITAVSDGESISWDTEPSLTWAPGNTPEADAAQEMSATDSGASPSRAENLPVEDGANSGTPSSGSIGSDDGTVTYVLNRNTMKFHEPDCSSVNTIKESNREDSSLSREEILAKGYVPCKNCNP